MKVAFYTLGCKVNQYDTQVLADALEAAGYELAHGPEDADIVVVNSCTVTAESDRKTRQAVRKFKRRKPECVVVLTGCMPQAFPDIAASLPEADIVLGNRTNTALPALLSTYFEHGAQLIHITSHAADTTYVQAGIGDFCERTRAIVKIEDGCDCFCSYCIVPYARGRVRSKPLTEIAAEVRRLADAGFKELVLVGINLSAYGSDIDSSLCDAVDIACATRGVERVRLGSLEPDTMTATMITRLKTQPKLCAHFHLSLQSGCDKTLKAMNRRYTSEQFRQLSTSLRAAFPDCTLTTDVMVGFPGETEEDFFTSLRFIEDIGFEKVHVFPYSVRKGTAAASMPEQIDNATKEKRARRMTAVAQTVRQHRLASMVGKTAQVLVENTDGTTTARGFTSNYIPVIIDGTALVCGELITVTITGTDDDGCTGTIG